MSGGFQFSHIQNFSRKGDKQGRTVSFVLSEARRDPAASMHVAVPRPPDIVWGCSLVDLEQEHDARVSEARKTISGGKTRAVGREQHTLMTVVMSHPYTVEEVEADPKKRRDVEQWEALNIKWLRNRFGEDLRSVIRHTDERHWHLHAYAIPGDVEMRASVQHPGQVAKSAVMAVGPAEGEDDKALRRRSDRAYKGAMKEWQDSYFRAVGMPTGLARIGPGKRRLTRSEWHQERNQALALKVVQEQAAALRSKVQKQASEFTSKTKGQVAMLLATAQAEADQVTTEATIRSELARAAEAKAANALQRAHRDLEQARRATATARRLQGFSGALRGLWDGLRKSSIVARVRAEIAPQLERWQSAISSADARAAAADRRRLDAEADAAAVRRSVAELGAQRDDLRRRLSAYEPTDAGLGVSAGVRHPR